MKIQHGRHHGFLVNTDRCFGLIVCVPIKVRRQNRSISHRSVVMRIFLTIVKSKMATNPPSWFPVKIDWGVGLTDYGFIFVPHLGIALSLSVRSLCAYLWKLQKSKMAAIPPSWISGENWSVHWTHRVWVPICARLRIAISYRFATIHFWTDRHHDDSNIRP